MSTGQGPLDAEASRFNDWCHSVVPEITNIATDFRSGSLFVDLIAKLEGDSLPHARPSLRPRPMFFGNNRTAVVAFVKKIYPTLRVDFSPDDLEPQRDGESKPDHIRLKRLVLLLSALTQLKGIELKSAKGGRGPVLLIQRLAAEISELQAKLNDALRAGNAEIAAFRRDLEAPVPTEWLLRRHLWDSEAPPWRGLEGFVEQIAEKIDRRNRLIASAPQCGQTPTEAADSPDISRIADDLQGLRAAAILVLHRMAIEPVRAAYDAAAAKFLSQTSSWLRLVIIHNYPPVVPGVIHREDQLRRALDECRASVAGLEQQWTTLQETVAAGPASMDPEIRPTNLRRCATLMIVMLSK
jgi:hypothetical protein